MKSKTIIRKCLMGSSEKVIVKRYASGEFMITSIPSWAEDRPDTDYVSPETFEAMKELDKISRRKE